MGENRNLPTKLRLVLNQYELRKPELENWEVDEDFLADFCIAYVYAGVERKLYQGESAGMVKQDVRTIIQELSGAFLDPEEEMFVHRAVEDLVELRDHEDENGPVL